MSNLEQDLKDACESLTDSEYGFCSQNKGVIYVRRDTKSITSAGTSRATTKVESHLGDYRIVLLNDGVKYISYEISVW